MTRISSVMASIIAFSSLKSHALQQNPPNVTPETRDAFDQILEFLYTISRWIGELIVNLVQSIVPNITIPASLVDAIGILAILTIFLVISDIAKRLAWIVVAAGWILIVVRIVLIVTQTSGTGG
ncbi:MAG: hypothetical protein ABEK03_01640 [Candidatus Bipolaricaulia bacterium]